MSKSYDTSNCFDNINLAINFVNTVVDKYIANIPLDSASRNQLTAFANAVRNNSIKTINIFGKSATVVLNKLSCDNYCSISGQATYNSTTKSCACKNTDYILKEDQYTFDNTNIKAGKCISGVDNFNEQLSSANNIITTNISNFNDKKITFVVNY